MTGRDPSTKPPDLPPSPDIDLDATALVLRRISAALRDSTPSEVPVFRVVERVIRRAAMAATGRLEALATLLKARALVEVGLVARLVFELDVSTSYMLVPLDESERLERAERFEAWDSYTMTKMLVGTANEFPLAGLAELYPGFAGVLREETRESARTELDALGKRFAKGSRTWSGKTLKDMAADVAAKSGQPSAYTLLYPMLSLFSHASPWSVAGPGASEGYLRMLVIWLFPYCSVVAAVSIWRQAWPDLPSPLRRFDLEGFWRPD